MTVLTAEGGHAGDKENRDDRVTPVDPNTLSVRGQWCCGGAKYGGTIHCCS